MLKKILSAILIVSFVLPSTSYVFASELDDQEMNTVYDIETKFDGIKMSSNGEYVMEFERNGSTKSGNILIPVGRLDIDLSNESSVTEVLKNNNIPDEVKAEIENKSKLSSEGNNKNLKATFFSTELLDNTRGSRVTDETKYHWYNNKKMRSDKLYTYNISTPTETVRKGKNTWDAVSRIKDIAISAAGVKSVYVSIFSTGITIGESFVAQYGEKSATGSDQDFCEVYLTYDDIDQWTYVDFGNGNGWEIGLLSAKVNITEVKGRDYFYDIETRKGSTDIISHENINKEQKSEHFDDPWAAAYQYASVPLDESSDITWKIGSVRFFF